MKWESIAVQRHCHIQTILHKTPPADLRDRTHTFLLYYSFQEFATNFQDFLKNTEKPLAMRPVFGYNNKGNTAKELSPLTADLKRRLSPMAKKTKHGKVEARQPRPRLRFRPGIPILIILVCFIGCFSAYMASALNQEDYWEKEIAAEFAQDNAQNAATEHNSGSSVVNPVPSSERADESRFAECAFLGDISGLSANYTTTPGMVFTDDLTSMSESRMHSIARSLESASPKAIYIWYPCPSDSKSAIASLSQLVDVLSGQAPIYCLTAIPSEDAAQNQSIDTWNAALFSLADEKGLYYVDINTSLKSNDGTLQADYAKDDAQLYKTIGDLILTHVVS